MDIESTNLSKDKRFQL